MSARAAELLRDVWDGLRSRPGRVGLACGAIGVGIVTLTLLLAFLEGLREQARRTIRELGVNVFAITPVTAPGGERAREALDERRAAYLAANLPACRVSPLKVLRLMARGRDQPVAVLAVGSAFAALRGWTLEAGRLLDARDEAGRERCVVLSRALAEAWGTGPGDTVMLGETPFRVIGVATPPDGALEAAQGQPALSVGERAALVPLSAVGDLDGLAPAGEAALDAVFVQAPEAADLDLWVARARAILEQPDRTGDEVAWITPRLLVSRLTRLQATITLTAGSVALLCLALGGTTLMTLMLANVRERVVEIGLRRALGASPAQVGALFLMEACLVTLAAGLAGALATLLGLALAGGRLPVPVRIGWGIALLPPLVSVLLGVLFSYWPARAAARIAPAEALRNE